MPCARANLSKSETFTIVRNVGLLVDSDMEKYPPIDSDGRGLKVGDWVRVIAVPLSIKGMPSDSREAFSKAVGHTFQIEAFDELGCLNLDMYPKVSCDTIYIEPFCVRRFRRYKKLSNAFQKRLAFLESLNAPRLEMTFKARLKPSEDLEAFGLELLALGPGGGFCVWPETSEVEGSISVEAANPNATSVLESVRSKLLSHSPPETIEVSEVRFIDRD